VTVRPRVARSDPVASESLERPEGAAGRRWRAKVSPPPPPTARALRERLCCSRDRERRLTAIDQDVLKRVRRIAGVVRVEFLASADREALLARASRGSSTNEGVSVTLRHDRVLCVFKDASFRPPPAPTLRLVDAVGTVVGEESIPGVPSSGPERGRVELLGRGFVLWSNVRAQSPLRWQLPPVPFPELADVPGVSNIDSGSPDPLQDQYLRERFRIPDEVRCGSVLVGYDLGTP